MYGLVKDPFSICSLIYVIVICKKKIKNNKNEDYKVQKNIFLRTK